jgi:hypothetical protein
MVGWRMWASSTPAGARVRSSSSSRRTASAGQRWLRAVLSSSGAAARESFYLAVQRLELVGHERKPFQTLVPTCKLDSSWVLRCAPLVLPDAGEVVDVEEVVVERHCRVSAAPSRRIAPAAP